MKSLKRVILAVIVLFALLCMAAYFTVKVAFPPEKIRALVHDYGSKALNRDVSVGDISIRIFPNLRVSVTEINVANAPGFSADPAIKLRELVLAVDFFSLLRFSPVIDEIKLVAPEILYETDAHGHNNLEGMGKSGGEKPVSKPDQSVTLPAALALNSFVLENGRVRYRDGKTGRELILGRINQRVSLRLDPKLENVSSQSELEIAEISVNDPESGLKKGNIRVTLVQDIGLNLPGERLVIKKLELGFQDIHASAKGEITRFVTGKPMVDVSLEAHEIRLASVLKEIPAGLSPDIAKLSLKGVAALDARIVGELDSGKTPELFAHLTVKDGAAAHSDLPASLDNLNLELNLSRDTLRLNRFGFGMAGNPVSMSALITSLAEPVPRLQSFDVNAVLDLGKLVPLLQKLGFLDKGIRSGGTVHAQVKASGPLDPKHPLGLKAQGSVELRGVWIESKDLPATLAASGRIKVDNNTIDQALNMRIGQSDVSVNGTVSNYLALVMPKAAKGSRAKAKLSVQSAFLNLDELLPGGEKKKTKDEVPATAWPIPPKLDADLDIKLAKTQFMNLAMTDFSSRTGLNGGIVTTALKGSLYSGGFTSSLKADLRDSSSAIVDLKLNVNRVEADDFISRLNDRLPDGNRFMKTLKESDGAIFGKINLAVDVKTRGLPQTLADNLTGTIGFSLSNGRLHETGLVKSVSDALGKLNRSWAFGDLTFSDLKADMTAEKGRLLIRDARIGESLVGSFAAKGSVGFDNSLSLSLENHLPADWSRAATGATGALTSQLAKLTGVSALAKASLFPTDPSGRVIIYLLAGGTLSKPTISLDARRMAAEAGAKTVVEDAFKQKKEELKARLDVEKKKLEDSAKARLAEEKKKLEQKAEEQKNKAAEEAKKQGKKLLKNLGF